MGEKIKTASGDEFEYSVKAHHATQAYRLELKRNGKPIPGMAVTDEVAQRAIDERGPEGIADLIGLFVGATINSILYASGAYDLPEITQLHQGESA